MDAGRARGGEKERKEQPTELQCGALYVAHQRKKVLIGDSLRRVLGTVGGIRSIEKTHKEGQGEGEGEGERAPREREKTHTTEPSSWITHVTLVPG